MLGWMSISTPPTTHRDDRSGPAAGDLRRDVQALVVVSAASLLVGGLTSVAQGVLPDWSSSFANSASGWTLVATLLVWWSRRRVVVSAVLGTASFVALVVGYTAASSLRGLSYDPTRFGVIAVLVGPVIGIAAVWLRSSGWRAIVAAAALAGVAVGEGIYGLTAIADTTSAVYWTVIGAVGLVLLAVVVGRQRPGVLHVVAGAALTALVATAFVVAYTALGS